MIHWLHDYLHPFLCHLPLPLGSLIFGLIFGLPVGVFIYALGWLLMNPFRPHAQEATDMTFEYAGEQYTISFKYREYGLPTDPRVTVRGVRCRIMRAADGGLIKDGHSYCHPNDNFCRETGRKLALKSALAIYFEGRGFRTAAWRAYLGRPRS